MGSLSSVLSTVALVMIEVDECKCGFITYIRNLLNLVSFAQIQDFARQQHTGTCALVVLFIHCYVIEYLAHQQAYRSSVDRASDDLGEFAVPMPLKVYV